MSHFSTALKLVLDRSFNGKMTAVSEEAEMHNNELGRLIREETPLTGVKLHKLLSVKSLPPADYEVLLHAGARDFLGEEAYKRLVGTPVAQGMRVQDTLGGITLRSLFPLSPRAQQVLQYLITKAEKDSDVVQALELLGKFLELPAPVPFTGAGIKYPQGSEGIGSINLAAEQV